MILFICDRCMQQVQAARTDCGLFRWRRCLHVDNKTGDICTGSGMPTFGLGYVVHFGGHNDNDRNQSGQ